MWGSTKVFELSKCYVCCFLSAAQWLHLILPLSEQLTAPLELLLPPHWCGQWLEGSLASCCHHLCLCHHLCRCLSCLNVGRQTLLFLVSLFFFKSFVLPIKTKEPDTGVEICYLKKVEKATSWPSSSIVSERDFSPVLSEIKTLPIRCPFLLLPVPLSLWPPDFPSPSMVSSSQLAACSSSWPMVDFN